MNKASDKSINIDVKKFDNVFSIKGHFIDSNLYRDTAIDNDPRNKLFYVATVSGMSATFREDEMIERESVKTLVLSESYIKKMLSIPQYKRILSIDRFDGDDYYTIKLR